jgi:hypothetical protein
MSATRSVLVALVFALAMLASVACGDGDGDGADAPRATATPQAERPNAPPPPPAQPAPPRRRRAWTHDAVMRRLDGRRIQVEGLTVPISRDTLTCGGAGPPARRIGGEPAWTRFRCIQPTFPPGEVAGPDAIFIVEPAGRSRVVVTDSRLTGY